MTTAVVVLTLVEILILLACVASCIQCTVQLRRINRDIDAIRERNDRIERENDSRHQLPVHRAA